MPDSTWVAIKRAGLLALLLLSFTRPERALAGARENRDEFHEDWFKRYICDPPCDRGEECREEGCVDARKEKVFFKGPTSKTAESIFGMEVNFLAAAQWGLTVLAEWGTAFSGFVRLRSVNLSAIPYAKTGAEAELNWGLGAAVGARWYSRPGGNLRGFFLGVSFEYYHLEGERPWYDWRLGFVLPQTEMGYRWVRDHLFFSLGASAGVLVEVFHEKEYPNLTHEEEAENAFACLEAIAAFGFLL